LFSQPIASFLCETLVPLRASSFPTSTPLFFLTEVIFSFPVFLFLLPSKVPSFSDPPLSPHYWPSASFLFAFLRFMTWLLSPFLLSFCRSLHLYGLLPEGISPTGDTKKIFFLLTVHRQDFFCVGGRILFFRFPVSKTLFAPAPISEQHTGKIPFFSSPTPPALRKLPPHSRLSRFPPFSSFSLNDGLQRGSVLLPRFVPILHFPP